MNPGMPGISSTRQMSWKKSWMKTIQPTSIPRVPSAAISQSSTATGANPSYMMLPTRASPQLMTVSPSSSGQLASSQSNASSTTGIVSSPRTQS